MKILFFLLISFSVFASDDIDPKFRCGNNLVQIGDFLPNVIAECGQPDNIYYANYGGTVYITYNKKTLTFTDGKLSDVDN